MRSSVFFVYYFFFFFKQKTAYEMRISDWSSDVCSSDLRTPRRARVSRVPAGRDRRRAAAGGTGLAALARRPPAARGAAPVRRDEGRRPARAAAVARHPRRGGGGTAGGKDAGHRTGRHRNAGTTATSGDGPAGAKARIRHNGKD